MTYYFSMITLLAVLSFYYYQIQNGNTSPEIIRDYAITESIAAGVNPQVVNHILKGESKYNVNVSDGDMGITCPQGPHKGQPVQARGPAQITKCYHPEISDAQARDPIFAVNFVVNQVKNGKCKKEFSTCPLALVE